MTITSLTSPNRRTFLKTSSALTVAGSGLMLGVSLGVPSAAQAAGIAKIGFVTEPASK